MIDFTPREISGILKAALLIADADGWNDYAEERLVMEELERLGVPDDVLRPLFHVAETMEPRELFDILRSLDWLQANYVLGFLAAVFMHDGDLDGRELKVWEMIAKTLNLEHISPLMAHRFWLDH